MSSKGEETRNEILEHALVKATEVGLNGLSFGELARELRMSKSGLYAHFGSKDALQVAVIDAAAAAFTDTVVRPALKARRGAPRVRAFLESWLAWHEHHQGAAGCLLVAASSELDAQPGPARDRIVEQQRDLIEFVTGAFELGVREGHFRPDLDPAQAAFEAYGLLLVYHLSARLLNRDDASRRARTGIERLLDDATHTTLKHSN